MEQERERYGADTGSPGTGAEAWAGVWTLTGKKMKTEPRPDSET